MTPQWTKPGLYKYPMPNGPIYYELQRIRMAELWRQIRDDT